MLLTLGANFAIAAAPTINVVPRPARVEENPGAGSFTLTSRTRIIVPENRDDVFAVATYLAEHLTSALGDKPAIKSSNAGNKGAIIFTTSGADAMLGDEGYELVSSEDNVTIRAPRVAGLFYGAQTLRQLLPPQIESQRRISDVAWTVPPMRIWDKPAYVHRGFMLDSCRHFQSVDFIKRTIDRLALYKINRFHWHLTEDQGWRIEITRYPRLTEVGAWRDAPDGTGNSPDHKKYGGFYAQDQIRDVVVYAEARHITIVPEIDMPGHMIAAIASYPNLACFPKKPYKVRTEWGISDDVLCPGKPGTYEFVTDVLSEVIDLFPSKVIHIGGDEAPRVRWKECAECQKMIASHGLKDEDALQNYFTKRIADFLRSRGRRLQGWNEIMHGGELAKDVIVHQWSEPSAATNAAKAGTDVVVSLHSFLYFDYDYKTTPIAKTYEFYPTPAGLNDIEAAHILGPQANLWTEHRVTEKDCDDYTWPRILAVAESGWTPRDQKNKDDFLNRLSADQCKRLAHSGLGAPTTQPAEDVERELSSRVAAAPASPPASKPTTQASQLKE
jgi:hexosaminidase